jgi:hypothetical protein
LKKILFAILQTVFFTRGIDQLYSLLLRFFNNPDITALYKADMPVGKVHMPNQFSAYLPICRGCNNHDSNNNFDDFHDLMILKGL